MIASNKRAQFVHRSVVTAKPLQLCSEVEWIGAETFHKCSKVVVVRLLHEGQRLSVGEHSDQCLGNVVTLEDVLLHTSNCVMFQAQGVTQPWERSTSEIQENIHKCLNVILPSQFKSKVTIDRTEHGTAQ